MQLTLTVCNVCQKVDRPTKRYEIKSEGRRATPDLCAEHAAGLEELLIPNSPELARTPRRSTQAKSGGGRRRVVSLDAIEEGKKAGTI